MPQANVQFSVASHMMASLASRQGKEMRSAELASSVNADPSFIRRVLSKLVKAGLVNTSRGKGGACWLARPSTDITLLDIYRASEAPATFSVHLYPVARTCQVSRNIKGCLDDVLCQAQLGFESQLAQQTLADIVERVEEGR